MTYKYRDINEDYNVINRSDMFDAEWYLSNYDINTDMDPLKHFLLEGSQKFYNPSPNFDTLWYLDEYGSEIEEDMNPLVHYIKYGVKKRYIPKLYDFEEIGGLNLNKTIRGKNDYLFLINDRNNELRHHFDKNYVNQFKYVDFIRDYYFKKFLFNQMNFKYYYFIVPDKSVVCKDLIPFKYDVIKRNTDKIDFVPDFIGDLTISDYWTYDTHINYNGAKKLVFNYLKHMDDSFTQEHYENAINECRIKEITEAQDLLHELNWSYTEKEKEGIKVSTVEVPIPKGIEKLKIPEEFLKCGKRDSEYFYNPRSLTNYRALIFRDSSTKILKFYLNLYFKEVFLYWDHLELNKDLIEWYKPNIIIEIRTERFIENYRTSPWIEKLITNM